MPTGIHNNHKGGKRASCLCGNCRKCKRRVWDKNYRSRNKHPISDEELERRLETKFNDYSNKMDRFSI